ncbi:MAG: potassium/proton antiporter [Egibacteraceae bacterium]
MDAQLPGDVLILAGAALLAAGVLSAGFAARLRVPGLLLFLGVGMLVGDDGLNLISLNNPQLAQNVAVLALLAILFEGGLGTKPTDLRRAAIPGFLLANVGVVVTAGVTAGAALLVLDVEPVTALLLGAVTASTDAAAVFSVLRRSPLPKRLTSLLEVESGANDPLAIVLTVSILAAVESGFSAGDFLVFGATQLLGGVVAGLLVGWAGSWVLGRVSLGAEGLYPVLALAVAGLAYGTAARIGGSGFFAVYLAGLIVGARVPRHRRVIRTFHDGVATTAEIALFLLLGLLVFPSQLIGVALPGLLLAAVLVFVSHPLATLACLVPLRFPPREIAMASWAGLRGAVPIVLATFPLTAGYPDGEAIFNIVFFIVLVSTALQGSSVGWVADRLGLEGDPHFWAPVAEALPLEGTDIDLVEVDMTPDLAVCGQRLRDVPPPQGTLVTAVVRNGRTHLPRATTRFQAGDFVLVAAQRRETATAEVVAWARGEEPTHPEPQ